MYITNQKIYLSPGENITSNKNIEEDSYLKLQTQFHGGVDLFVNRTLVEILRDETHEHIHRTIFAYEYSSLNMSKASCLSPRMQKIFYRNKLKLLRQLYISYQVYKPKSHFVEKFVPKEEEIVVPSPYSSIDIRDTVNGSWVTSMNTETIIANRRMEYGVSLSLQDQELIRRLEKRKK